MVYQLEIQAFHPLISELFLIKRLRPPFQILQKTQVLQLVQQRLRPHHLTVPVQLRSRYQQGNTSACQTSCRCSQDQSLNRCRRFWCNRRQCLHRTTGVLRTCGSENVLKQAQRAPEKQRRRVPLAYEPTMRGACKPINLALSKLDKVPAWCRPLPLLPV